MPPVQEAAGHDNDHKSLEDLEEKRLEVVDEDPTMPTVAVCNDEEADASEFYEPQHVPDVIPFGDKDEEVNRVVNNMSMCRKGCIKASPYKISMCLRRMEELEKVQGLSQRAIATKVASEFSTK